MISKILHYYVVRTKFLKKALAKGAYDKLILRHQEAVNRQRNINLMYIGDKFFETEVNLTPSIATSKSISIRKFLFGIGRISAIEPTSDTKDFGKYILIVNNSNYPHAIKKIEELLKHLYGKNTHFQQ